MYAPSAQSKNRLLAHDGIDNTTMTTIIEVITVPDVPGRLLRFQGDYLHAVPRPTDVWFLSFVQGVPKYNPEEEWGRSEVLFNTWRDEPPLGILLDECIPDAGVGVDDDSIGGAGGSAMDLDTRHSRFKWSETYTLLSSSQEDISSCPQMSLTTAKEEDDNDNTPKI